MEVLPGQAAEREVNRMTETDYRLITTMALKEAVEALNSVTSRLNALAEILARAEERMDRAEERMKCSEEIFIERMECSEEASRDGFKKVFRALNKLNANISGPGGRTHQSPGLHPEAERAAVEWSHPRHWTCRLTALLPIKRELESGDTKESLMLMKWIITAAFIPSWRHCPHSWLQE